MSGVLDRAGKSKPQTEVTVIGAYPINTRACGCPLKSTLGTPGRIPVHGGLWYPQGHLVTSTWFLQSAQSHNSVGQTLPPMSSLVSTLLEETSGHQAQISISLGDSHSSE